MKTSFYLRYFVFFVFMVCFLKGFSQDLENLKDHPPFKISGNLGVKLTTYQSIDRETSRDPFSWYLTGSPVVSIYGINIPFSFSVSDQQTSYKQSFSTIGASPYYKWLMLHLGYRSLQFGKFTLSGNTMLGAGFEVSLPKGLHIGYMYGRFNKAIDYEYDEAEDEDDYTITPTFKNTASSYKIGYSKNGNYMLISFLRGRDHENSLSETTIDSLCLFAEENAAIGLSCKYTFNKKLTFKLEMGNSLYTKNINDTVGDISNNNFMGSMLSGVITTNASTINAGAIEANISYKEKYYGAKLKYKRIEDNYQSMGTYYFQNDVQNITIAPWAYLWKRKVKLNTSIGLQNTNLTDETATQTTRLVKSAKINLRPLKWYSLYAAYSDYETDKIRRIKRLDTIYQTTQTTMRINLNQTINLGGRSHSHMILTNYLLQNMENTASSSSTSYNSQSLIFTYNYSYNPLYLDADINFGYSNYITYDDVEKTFAWEFGVSKKLLNKRLRLGVDYSWDKEIENDIDDRAIHKTMVKARWSPKNKKHSVSLLFTNKKVNDLVDEEDSYKTRLLSVGYNYRF